MTRIKITTYALLLFASALALAGVMTVYASEVTGTLSSDSSFESTTSGEVEGSVSDDVKGDISGTVSTDTKGELSGTVSGGSSGGSGGSSGGGTRVGDRSNESPDGAVLGESTDNLSAPAFPNTGAAPVEKSTDQTN